MKKGTLKIIRTNYIQLSKIISGCERHKEVKQEDVNIELFVDKDKIMKATVIYDPIVDPIQFDISL